MIKSKYKLKQTLKSRADKLVQKCETTSSKTFILKSYSIQNANRLENEMAVYDHIVGSGFSQIAQAFYHQNRFYLAFPQLGCDLETLRVKCGGRLSLKTVLMVGLQLLDRIEVLHSKGFTHGDIKPSNFLIGKLQFKHKIYLIDFQLSSQFIRSGKHVAEDQKHSLSGTLKFMSKGANSKLPPCRRDDIESLVYSLIFLLKGTLPWAELKATNLMHAFEETLERKNAGREELLEGVPLTLGWVLVKLEEMKFQSSPDYNSIRGAWKELMKKNGYEMDYKYDWEYI